MSDTFSYDWQRRWLTIGADPQGHTIEVSRRPNALLLAGPGRSSIRGIGFRRFASNQYSSPTRAAVVSAAHTLTVENTVFIQNAAQGLSVSKPWDGAVVRRSVFVDNGYTALGANGGSREGRRTHMLVEQNIFRGNNAERFGERCTISCGAAAAKFAHIRGLTVTGNLVTDTRGPAAGLWCDLDCSDTVYSFNIVRGHLKSGIFHEVSDTGWIVGNLLIGNEYGVNVASARTKVYHNTLIDNVQGIRVYGDLRSRGKGGWDDVGPDTSAVSVVNNVVSGRSYSLKTQGGAARRTSNPQLPRLFDRVEGNIFHQPTYQPKFAVLEYADGTEVECQSASLAQPCSIGRRDIWLSDVADPLFVDRRLGDYRVRPDSPATRGATSLPADVAEVLGGDSNDSPLSRGALARP